MPLGSVSKTRLGTCDPDLIRLFEAVAAGVDAGECIGVKDVTVLCGFRGRFEQDQAYAKGNSKLRWPFSKHNKMPARAADVVPYPVDFDNLESFKALRAYVLMKARHLGIRLRIISWDWPHYELDEDEPPPTKRGVG